MKKAYLPSDSTSMFLHLPSTITKWWPPLTGCWNKSNAVSVLLARDDSMLRWSQARLNASEAWSSLWNTRRALMAGFGGMRCGNFPSLNFCWVKKGQNWVGEKLFLSKSNQFNLMIALRSTAQTTNIGSNSKLCSSNESPPSDDNIDLRTRCLLIRSIRRGKINECNEWTQWRRWWNLATGLWSCVFPSRQFHQELHNLLNCIQAGSVSKWMCFVLNSTQNRWNQLTELLLLNWSYPATLWWIAKSQWHDQSSMNLHRKQAE